MNSFYYLTKNNILSSIRLPFKQPSFIYLAYTSIINTTYTLKEFLA